MRRTLLAAVLLLLFTVRAAYSQQTATSDLVPAFSRPASPALPQPPSPQPDDIQALKASILQLQDRLNHMAPAPGGKVVELGPPPDVLYSAGDCKTADAADWPLNAHWKYGLQLQSKDEAFRVHVGGNLAFDYGWNAASQTVQFGAGGIGELQDGAQFRFARIRIDGAMYQHFEWVAEFDFANSVQNDTAPSGTPIGSPSFTKVWVGVNDVPLLGTLRAGWMDEPIGFSHLSSIRWLNFMERPPGVGGLSLTSPGVMLLDASKDQRVTWAFGFYHAQNDNFGFGIGDGQYAETGRLTWLPWYADDGSELLHLGIGATHRHLDNNEIDLRGRPSVRTMPGVLEPALADTGTIGGSTLDGLDVELAGVYGPWTLQSEYYCIFIHDALVPNQPPPTGVPLGTLFYQGAYVELLYFLTSEYRAYDRREAVFDRVIPRRNFNIWSEEYSWGAWQVGIRYTYLDLQNKGVNGATLNDIVLGLNWFLNPNAKIQWNLAIDHRQSTLPGSSGWTYIFGSTVAIDF